jgi:plasmid stabilization system protein ParE
MTPSPEIIAKARQDYLDGRPVAAICKECGLSQFTLYVWIDGGPASAAERLPPLPRRTDAKPAQPRKLTVLRETMVRRLWRAAERQVRDIEQRLVKAGQEPAERERDTRIMAVLVKTLGELSALGEDRTKTGGGNSKRGGRSPKAAEHHDGSNDGSEVIGIEEFRRELASRLAALVGDAATDAAGEPGTSVS